MAERSVTDQGSDVGTTQNHGADPLSGPGALTAAGAVKSGQEAERL